MIILFACSVGWLNSSHLEIKEKLMHDLAWAYTWAGMITSMHMQV
jgi:hypothetical protein